MQHKFLKTTVTINGRKYWYRSTSRGNYEIYLSEAKHEGETALRFEGVKPVYLGSMRKATYEAGGRTHQIDDTWEFVLKVNGEFLDFNLHEEKEKGRFYGFTKSFVANAPTYTCKWLNAKDAFVLGIRHFDSKIAQIIRSSWDKVFNPITKEWIQPYDESYVDPIGSPVVKVTDCIDSLRRMYGEDDALALAGQVLTVCSWNVDNPHRWPQDRIFATISQQELIENTTKNDWRAGIRLYPHMFKVISGERTLSDVKEHMPVYTCDICEDTDETGYVDDAHSFKVCKRCDVDGDNFDVKHWPSDVLLEIGYISAPMVESVDEIWDTAHIVIHGCNFEFNPYADKVEGYLDMTSLELIQEGLMNALLDVQQRISRQAMADVREASDVVDEKETRIRELRGLIAGLKNEIEVLGWCREKGSMLDEAQEELEELMWGDDAE